MRFLRPLALVVLGLGWPASLEADILVTLATHDLEGQPVASDALTPGVVVSVDILLAVDGDDLPLADVRLIQFDFSATSPNIIIDQFEWRLDPGLSDSTYLQFSDLHQPSAVYLGQGRRAGFIIDLDETPVRVATLSVTVNETGTLDVLNVAGVDAGAGAALSAGFFPRVDFSARTGDITGGAIELELDPAQGSSGGTGGSSGGDGPDDPGVGDDEDDDAGNVPAGQDPTVNDDLPDDPSVATTNDPVQPDLPGGENGNDDFGAPVAPQDQDDEVGREVDPDAADRNLGPRVVGGLCGAAMLPTLVCTLCGLALLRFSRRRSKQP
ncbi:MAG: hypothetical protein IIC01_08480 [Planctomycetes bacterium]|nr:hypothetical protein [Planctomycetota bacterium]